MWGLKIRWYGFMYIVGFIAAFFLLRKFSKEKLLKLSYAQIDTLLFYSFMGLFIGSRIFYVLFYNFNHYFHSPWDIFAIWKGGLSFHGGLLGIIIGIYILSRKQHLSFWNISDNIVICAPIGIGLVRIGNFINGELFGRLTHGSWGIIFSQGGPHPRHPSQLYESFFEGLILFILMYTLKSRLPSGRLSALFLIFYGIFRFFLEFFRQPDEQLGFVLYQFSMGQIFCLAMIIFGIIMWKCRKPS